MFSQKDNQIIVNYHYVEDPRSDRGGISPCPVIEFDRQIGFLAKNYKIVSLTEIFEAAKSGLADRLCAITFDDGLKDQYQNALPILRKYGAVATFFVITGALEGRLPTAQKTHEILSEFSPEEAVDAFNTFISEFYPDFRDRYFLSKDKRLTERRMHEPIAIANLKERLIQLPEDIKGRFLRYCFKKLKLGENKIAGETFMDKKEIVELTKLGMAVGNHTHSHYAFDSISVEVMRDELAVSQKHLKEILGNAPEVFSYPHGRWSSVAVDLLRAMGIKYAATIDRRGIDSRDDTLLIPRYDTMDLKSFLDNIG